MDHLSRHIKKAVGVAMCGMENGQWIQRHLSELAESTKIDGKIWRASYTEEDGIGHRMFRRWIEEAGLE